MNEAAITINGHVLTEGQSMALRVAVTDFYSQMQNPEALGTDEHGLRMVEGYRARLYEVLRQIGPTTPTPGVIKRLLGGSHGG